MCHMTNCMMLVGELSVLVLFLGLVQQCGGGSSSALDSFLQGVLRVQQTLPQRSRRNVVKRPGVSLDHEDLQELQGVNTDVEDEGQVYTGLDEASILRELQEVSGSANLSKRQSEDRTMSVAFKKAQLQAVSSKSARKNKGPQIMQFMRDKQPSDKGNAGLLTGLKQLPIYSSREDRSRSKVGDKYGLRNKLSDTDYGEVTFVKLQYLPKHKYAEEKEKAGINVGDVGNVKIISNRKENLDGNYEMNNGKSEVEEHLNTAAPYKKINDAPSKSLLNEKRVGETFREDSIANSQQKTGAPEIHNSIHMIRPMNNFGSSMEESWDTNDQKRPDEVEGPQSIKDKEDLTRPGYLNYLNKFNNYKDYNNIQDNYEDADLSSQKFDNSEFLTTKADLWHDVHFNEIESETSMVNPYKEILFQDPKLTDNENLLNSMDSVSLPARHHSLSYVSRIGNSDGGGPTQMSDYLHNTYRHSDVGRVVTKDDSRRNFIRRYPHRDSLVKDKISIDENMFAHPRRSQKTNIVDKGGEFFSNYPEVKQVIHSQYLLDSRRKFAGKDPEILAIHEADLKYQGGYEHTLADLINGELVNDIARSIMNKVISDVNLRRHISSDFGPVTKGKTGRAAKLAPTAEEMYCASRCTVERRADKDATNNGIPQSKCLALPSELKEFLKWMLEGGKEEVHSENQNLLLPDQLVFYSAQIRESLTTKVPEVGNKTYDPTLKKKMQLVLQLLAEYEQLNDDEKDTVSKVHHYLQEELEQLQSVPTEASNANATTVGTLDLSTSSLDMELIQNFTSMPQETIKFSLPEMSNEVDLIRKQLEMLGLGKNAKLGQRLSDRFEYTTKSTVGIPLLPQKSIPLHPLLDNYDSAFK